MTAAATKPPRGAPPESVEIITLSGIEFERFTDGREIARRDGKIIADITPNGEGYGGWVYWLGGPAQQRFDRHNLQRVESRADGRAMVVEWDT